MSEVEVKTTKFRVAGLLLLLISFLILAFLTFHFVSQQYKAVDPDDKTLIQVEIPENSNAQQVALILKEKGLVHSEAAFLSYCRKNHIDNQLKAGNFKFSRSQPVSEIAMKISKGNTIVSDYITVPEGYTVKQIGQLLIEKNISTAKEWQQAVEADYNYSFINNSLCGEKRLEGFLFPDTYAVDEQSNSHSVINMMLDNFDKLWQDNFAKLAQDADMSINEAVIVASLIEREAMVASEREKISGVIQNRIKIGMPLQIDASVLYSLGEHKESVSLDDLKVDSPYNTYKNAGLPPGPIACPGKASIAAALNPEKHSYYYYLAKGDGSHYFSKTYAEHIKAKNKYGL